MNSHGAIGGRVLDDTLLASLTEEFSRSAAEYDETAAFPFANFERLSQLGLLALTVPKSYGGLGGGLRDTCRLVQAVGGGEASTGLVLAMSLIMHHMVGYDRPPVYEDVAKAAIGGRGILNALRAEPDLGSPSRGGLPNTVARRLPDGSWQLNGRKAYATGSPIAQWWLMFARTEEDQPRIGRWLVPANAPGLEAIPSWNHVGLRATASHDLKVENVVVPAESVLTLNDPQDPEVRARGAILETWNGLVLASLYTGIARAGRDWLVKFLHERTPSNLGAPLATVPRLQSVVGEIDSLLFINRTVINESIANAEIAEKADPTEAMLAKHIATSNAVKALELALSITGNHGLDRANPLERHYRDALCGRVHAPQTDTIFLNVGRQAVEKTKA
ncbi:acyl-CoA dehydrogenase family protein [Neorhizobium sp. JUb45]|uniref:acyl-CoA dehydrogenase family protein n=1 Tax=Neorhizobium sp. JUb45 TaxID=2485113 RepID=UPI001048DD1D|nr:acyl-CoA dehydrogenase family protein [Neorhizobium sp. JUb45]TCQ99086.1 alkylation response protein AidB-like acyl-CoA dehydrogenase [Neorhizobium sp. JUb45]